MYDKKQMCQKCWTCSAIITILIGLSVLITCGIIFIAKLILKPQPEAITLVQPTKSYYFHLNNTNQNLSREGIASLPDRPKSAFFYIHGFLSPNLEEAESIKIKDVILEFGDVDVVVLVDWCDASYKLGIFAYPAVATTTIPVIAEHVKEEIKWVEKNLGISRTRIKMAGHSLGAHIMGRAGELLYKDGKERGKIRLMVGLDPAGPLFDEKFPTGDHRLSKDDAENVLCIHTDDILGTTNRSCCHKHLYPIKDNGSDLDFPGRHNSVKKLFVGYLEKCPCLGNAELEIGWWHRFLRRFIKGYCRETVIESVYSCWVAVLYIAVIPVGSISVLVMCFCFIWPSICYCIFCSCRKPGYTTLN